MRGRLSTWLLAGLAASTAVFPPAVGADAGVRLQRFLDGLTSLRAEFRQTVTDARGRLIERAEGSMSLLRPGRFRWEYRVPEQLIVSDGKTIWHYDIELEQVTIRGVGETLAGTPAQLLAGQGDLDEDFSITDAGVEKGLQWNLLTPRRTDADFREVRLGFADRELRRMQLLDRLGQTTELEFLQIERNPRLDAAQFSFVPPPGVDVVGRAPAG
jgi:outer membrane lipoprotein carrier protein